MPRHKPQQPSPYKTMSLEQLEAELKDLVKPEIPNPFHKNDPKVLAWQQAHHTWQCKRDLLELHITLRKSGWTYPSVPAHHSLADGKKPKAPSNPRGIHGARHKKISAKTQAKIDRELKGGR